MIELTQEVKQQVIDIVRTDLAETYAGDGPIVFDPIVIDPRIDPDGEPYFHIYVVYDGDDDLMDVLWTADLIRRIRPQLEAMGIPETLSKSFVEKSEWEEIVSDRYRYVREL